MIKSAVSSMKKVGALLALASGLVLTSTSTPALAANPTSGGGTGKVTFVEVRDGILLVGINGVGTAFAYSVPAPSPCQSWVQSADALKRFQSHAEAALLSGKQLGIAYNICDPDGQKIKHIWALSIGG